MPFDEGTHRNQRKGHRLPVRLPYSLVTGAGSDEITIPAESINVSKSGMRLKTEAQLSDGQLVVVILLEVTPHPVRARVVWVGQPTSPDHYELGLEYIVPSLRPV